MGFIDLMKKLGILRCEAKAATYTNAKERPKEFSEDIDIERDLKSMENFNSSTDD
jgi:hypothetical protein